MNEGVEGIRCMFCGEQYTEEEKPHYCDIPSGDGIDEAARRPLSESWANTYEHVGDGMTLGTVCEHPPSGAWVLVIDIRDDGQVLVVNLDEVPDIHCLLLEDAYGCREHAQIGRGIAAQHPEAKYIGPPESFQVLGPVHPDYRRATAQEGLPDGDSP